MVTYLEKKLNACQQFCLRRLLRISHLQRVTNTEVLRRTSAGARKIVLERASYSLGDDPAPSLPISPRPPIPFRPSLSLPSSPFPAP